MDLSLVFHISAGSVGIVSGFIALYAAKGAPLHRRIGMAFVISMLAMTTSGAVIAALRNAAPAVNVPAAILTAYLVATALITLRPITPRGRWLRFAAMGVAFATGLFTFRLGLEAVALGGVRQGIPAFPFFLFATIGVLGAIGDLRLLRAGGITGARRINRHLWRMGIALFIAAMSFFIGQMDEFPKGLRIIPLLMAPSLAILITLLYWIWRVRIRQSLRGLLHRRAPESAS